MLTDYGDLEAGCRVSAHRCVVDQDMVADYARAVQDRSRLLGEDGSELVPPMAVAALSIRGVVQDLRIPGGTLHVGQEFEFSGGVAVGSSLDCVATLAQNSIRGEWRFLAVKCEVNDGSGDAVMTGKSTIMIPSALGPRPCGHVQRSAPRRDVAGDDDEDGATERRFPLPPVVKRGDSLPEIERMIDQPRIERYAHASGDFNPIHIDREFAASTQFGGTIAHGMMVAATISEMMTRVFGRCWADKGKMKIRFRAPVRPGGTITASGSVRNVVEADDGDRALCVVSVVTEDGETAISGQTEVTVPKV